MPSFFFFFFCFFSFFLSFFLLLFKRAWFYSQSLWSISPFIVWKNLSCKTIGKQTQFKKGKINYMKLNQTLFWHCMSWKCHEEERVHQKKISNFSCNRSKYFFFFFSFLFFPQFFSNCLNEFIKVSDPQNLGAIIRSASYFDVDGIIQSTDWFATNRKINIIRNTYIYIYIKKAVP